MDITSHFCHVSAGTHLSHRADDAVGKTGQTSPCEAFIQFYAHLFCYPGKLGCTGRFDGNGNLFLFFHNGTQQVFIFQDLHGSIFNIYAPTHGNQKEEILGHSAHFYSKINDITHFIFVPIHDSGVDLERQTSFTTIFHTLHGAGVSLGMTAEVVVLFFIQAVQADAHSGSATVF